MHTFKIMRNFTTFTISMLALQDGRCYHETAKMQKKEMCFKLIETLQKWCLSCGELKIDFTIFKMAAVIMETAKM